MNENILNGTILPDMFYVKAEHKEAFLQTVKAKIEWSSTNKAHKYPQFLKIGNGRKCDFSGEILSSEDDVYCVFVEGI